MIFRTTLFMLVLFGLVACAENNSSPARQMPAASDVSVAEAERLGQGILDIQYALDNPDAPDALNAVTRLGHDSRYYVLVRGWLVQELQGLQSISASGAAEIRANQRAKLDFVQQAIRAIDLE